MHGREGPGRESRVLSVKLGGSVITDKEKPFTLRLGLVEQVAGALAEAAEATGSRYMIVLGGGSYGHVAAHELRRGSAPVPEALSAITAAMLELAQAVADVLSMKGLRPVLYPPHAFCQPRGLRPGCAWRHVLEAFHAGATPVLYGDAYPCSSGWCIVSGDELAVEAACAIGASHVLYVSDVDGIYGVGGKLLERVTLNDVARLASLSSRQSGYDVTGGLARKIEALRENWCSTLRGVWVVNGLFPERVKALIMGERVPATLVLP